MMKARLFLAVLAAGLVVTACATGNNRGSGGTSGSASGGGSGTATGGMSAPAVCGDGVVEAGEACDGSNLNNTICSSLGFAGGTLACAADCEFDASGCAAPDAGTGGASGGGSGLCGNGMIDPGEACDGSDLVNATCTSLGFTGGTLACSTSCQFNVSACTGGSITPAVIASRTTCAAPCSVFFDATTTTGLAGGTGGTGGTAGGDYVQANWTWDFNDPTSPHKGTIGFVAAHVFDNPGIYHVTTRVEDLAGNAGSKTTTITVTTMSGTTYYVAGAGRSGAVSGNDSNSGKSTTTPFLTLAQALKVAGTNDSILLRRGDTFNIGSSAITLAQTGPFLLGAYSDPMALSASNPILNSAATVTDGSAFIVNGTDVRFTDVHVVNTGGFIVFNLQGGGGNLWERVEAEGTTQAGGQVWVLAAALLKNEAVVDSNAHDFNGYGLYADRSVNTAIIGTTFTVTNTADNEHIFRFQGGSSETSTSGQFTNNTYVAENVATSPMGGMLATDGTFRGDDTNMVYVNNTADRAVAIVPQNTTATEHVSLGLVEGNMMYRPDYSSGESCVAVTAKHIVLRNNVCPNADIFAKVNGSPQLPANWTDQIYILNNTFYLNQTPTFSNPFVEVGMDQATTGTVTIENNIMVTMLSTSNQDTIYQTSGGATIVSDYNDLYVPNVGKLAAPNVGTHGILTNPNFASTTVGSAGAFTLSSGSPAVDTGTNTHVYQSLGNAPGRPQNSVWDMGAFELRSP